MGTMTILLILGLAAVVLVIAWGLAELISSLVMDVRLQDEIDQESDDEVY